jgi:hypothetical protein
VDGVDEELGVEGVEEAVSDEDGLSPSFAFGLPDLPLMLVARLSVT